MARARFNIEPMGDQKAIIIPQRGQESAERVYKQLFRYCARRLAEHWERLFAPDEHVVFFGSLLVTFPISIEVDVQLAARVLSRSARYANSPMVGVYVANTVQADFVRRPDIGAAAYRATMIAGEGGILVVGPDWSHILTIDTLPGEED
jgi:hypothetical protein